MTKSLDAVKEVTEFVPEKADTIPLRENGYNVNSQEYETSEDKKYKAGENLEVYSCDAGCKNCHCATY